MATKATKTADAEVINEVAATTTEAPAEVETVEAPAETEQQPAAPAEGDTKAAKAFMARVLLVSQSSDELLVQLYKDPSSKEARKAFADASQEVIGQATATASLHLRIITEDASLKTLPDQLIKEAKESLGDNKKNAVLTALRLLTRECFANAAEMMETYSNLGPVYAGVPIGVDAGLELGIQTGEGDNLQRTGLVFGLRCDHLGGRRPSRAATKLMI